MANIPSFIHITPIKMSNLSENEHVPKQLSWRLFKWIDKFLGPYRILELAVDEMQRLNAFLLIKLL